MTTSIVLFFLALCRATWCARRSALDPMPPTRVPFPFISFHFFWRMLANENKWQLVGHTVFSSFFLLIFCPSLPPISLLRRPSQIPVGRPTVPKLTNEYPEILGVFCLFFLFFSFFFFFFSDWFKIKGGNCSLFVFLKCHYLRDFHRANSCLFVSFV